MKRPGLKELFALGIKRALNATPFQDANDILHISPRRSPGFTGPELPSAEAVRYLKCLSGARKHTADSCACATLATVLRT